MKQKNLSVVTLILFAATAAIWLTLCARDLLSAGQTDGLRVLNAVLWSVAFFGRLLQFLRQRRNVTLSGKNEVKR